MIISKGSLILVFLWFNKNFSIFSSIKTFSIHLNLDLDLHLDLDVAILFIFLFTFTFTLRPMDMKLNSLYQY